MRRFILAAAFALALSIGGANAGPYTQDSKGKCHDPTPVLRILE